MKGTHPKQHSKFSLILIKLAACCGLLIAPYVQAANIPRAPQGSQLLPQAPSEHTQSFPSNTGLYIEPLQPILSTNKATLYVRQIKICGNTLFNTPTLHALVADGEGKTLNLNQLNALAARISHYYQQHGYQFSRAYIPAQNIQNGIVQFNVLEARYGTIRIKNTSRLSSYRANLMLSALKTNDFIEGSKLNRSLLLLDDLPGIVTSSTLGPGKTVGSSDLQVFIKPTDLMNGFIGIDNYGSPYTGRTRYNASLQFNNPTGQGDHMVIEGVSSGRDLM